MVDLSLPGRVNGGPYIFGILDGPDPERDLILLGRHLEPGSAVYGPVHFSNEVFTMHHYCNCGDSLYCDYCREDFVEPLPNFHYKPTDLKIWWYKWILRDPSSNRECSAEEWKKLILHCRKSCGYYNMPWEV